MKLVRESIDFKRGGDPKKALGIGIDPGNRETFVPYLLQRVPSILGTRDIPDDFEGGDDMGQSFAFIKTEYAEIIMSWLIEKFGIDDYPLYNIWRDLAIAAMEWRNRKGSDPEMRP